MIILSAKELYNQAQVLAGCYNSDFLTFSSAIDFINNKYRILYDKIVQSDSDFYLHDFLITENDTPLPDDLYNIKTVRMLSNFDHSFTPIERQPEKSYQSGTYTIINNIFHYNGQITNPIQIRYNPVPLTITMPFELEEIDIDAIEFGKMYDDGIYYKTTLGEEMFYDFNTRDSRKAENYKNYNSPYKIDYEEQTVFDENNEDISEYFTSIGEFTAIYVDEDYAMASYKDGSIYVFQNLDATEWNVKATTGHKTKGKIFGLHTDDETGYGCIFFDERDDKFYHAPFVPDTLLSYTNNTLFFLLELQLAILLGNLAGTDTNALQEEERKAQESFYSELRQNKSGPLRVNNTAYKRFFR